MALEVLALRIALQLMEWSGDSYGGRVPCGQGCFKLRKIRKMLEPSDL